jgi:endonuclease YncB( thermonuclease family)
VKRIHPTGSSPVKPILPWLPLALLLFSTGVLPCPGARAAPDWLELNAGVTNVYDGNRLRVVDYKGTVHLVRLSGSDAPELGQPGGIEARKRLRELIDGQTVRIVHRYFDARGRILGKIYVDRIWANKVLVEEGLAWYFDPDDDAPELRALERKARERKKGIWRRSAPIPPWHWRRGVRVPRPGLENERPRPLKRSPSTNDRPLIGVSF